MDAQVLNFMAYRSGLMVGLFDLSVSGIVVTGCKAFRKDDQCWFAWPSEKRFDWSGKDQWHDIVTASKPVMHHLQNLVRGQLRAILEGRSGSANQPSTIQPDRRSSRTPKVVELCKYKSSGKNDEIPF
jgi:hypothetical protein